MAIQTAQGKENLATAYASNAAFLALYSTAGSSTAGTELTGGSPAYARKAPSVNAGSVDGITTLTATFDIPSGATVAGWGVHTAVTGGSYLDGGALTSQAYASQGQYILTVTFTQS